MSHPCPASTDENPRGTPSDSMRSFCPQILLRPWTVLPQLIRGPQWPVRIAQNFPRQKNHVGLPGANDAICLLGRGNHPHGRSRNPCFFANSFGKRYLISRARRNRNIRYRSPRRTIDQIHASPTESSMVHPPFTQSDAEIRTNNGRVAGQVWRTACATSRKIRVRFSNEPP